MKVLGKIYSDWDLGYECWLLVDSFGANDVLLVDAGSDQPKVARCHPVIKAEQMHVDALGCELGDLICGVRWLEPYNGQEVINKSDEDAATRQEERT